MTLFVVLAALMTAAAMAIVLIAPRSRASRVTPAAVNLDASRLRLHELADEHARGRIDAAECAALQDEVRRRLLAEMPQQDAAAAPRRRSAHIAIAIALPALAALVYATTGAPEAIERPADPTTAQLEAHVAQAPGDARAWVLLARRHMDAEAFEAAARAYARAIDESPRVAADAQVWAEYADALGMTQGGTLAGAPRAAVERALALDPTQPKALELAGSAAYEARDFGAAHAYWSALLEQVPEDSPLRSPLRVAVDRAERLARLSRPAS